MTGFGEATLERDGVFVSVEVSSVNNRHSKVNVNLSDHPRFRRRVEQVVLEHIDRGKIDVEFKSNAIGPGEESVFVEDELVDWYTTETSRLSDEYDQLDARMDVGDLLELPGVLKTARESSLEEETKAIFIETLEDALDNLVSMREEEGQSIARDLHERGERLRSLLGEVESAVPEALERHRENLLEKMEEALELPDDDLAERLENELKMYADKCDISEETVRIGSHLDQFEEYLDQEGAVGKSLEFLLQEIQREVNTVGAKANDAAISQCTVDMKTELEKCREQVRNVE